MRLVWPEARSTHDCVAANYLEAAIGIEPMNKGFADLCLTTWLRRPKARIKDKGGRMKETILTFQCSVYRVKPKRHLSATTLKTKN